MRSVIFIALILNKFHLITCIAQIDESITEKLFQKPKLNVFSIDTGFRSVFDIIIIRSGLYTLFYPVILHLRSGFYLFP